MVNIADLIKNVRKSVENDSFLYLFENEDFNSFGFSYDWAFKEHNVLDSNGDIQKDSNGNIKTETNWHNTVRPVLEFNKVIGTYYKNNNGNWIDLKTILKEKSSQFGSDIKGSSIKEIFDNEQYRIKKENIPEISDYIDSNSKIWHIPSMDGEIYKKIVKKDYGDNDIYLIDMKVCDIDNPSNDNLPHICKDLLIEVKSRDSNNDKITNDIDINNSLLVIDGRFLPMEKIKLNDGTFDKRKFYVRNGKTFLVPTKITDENSKKYYYNPIIHIFQWRNVTISDYLRPTHINLGKVYLEKKNDKGEIIYSKNVLYLKTLYYKETIDSKSCILFLNDKILNENIDYWIKDSKIHIKNMDNIIKSLYNEYDVSKHPNPIRKIDEFINGLEYNLVILNHKEGNKKAIINKIPVVSKNNPFPNDLVFSDYTGNDILIVDGYYAKHVKKHENVVSIPYASSLLNNPSKDSELKITQASKEIKSKISYDPILNSRIEAFSISEQDI